VLDALRPIGLPPGDYLMPRPANPAENALARVQSEATARPCGAAHGDGRPWSGSMVANLSQWFVYCLVVSASPHTSQAPPLPAGATFTQLCRFAVPPRFSATHWRCGGVDLVRRAWTMTLKGTFDGLISSRSLRVRYFTWMWPH